MTHFHCITSLRMEDAGGWRHDADRALAWLVYAPAGDSTAAWLARLPAPWPEDTAALLEFFGAAAREVRVATGAAAAWSGGSLDVAWVGDVRVVLVRGGRSVATTADHSMARELGLPDHNLARITSRSLGLHPPERARWDTRPGDVLLLCAPHLHDFRPEVAWLADALDPRTSLPGRLLLCAE